MTPIPGGSLAAELQTSRTDSAVVARRVGRIRVQVDRLMWVGIVLGVCFTMTTVQAFAAAGAGVGSLAWCAAWLVDPMVSSVLVAVLRAEQLTTRYQVRTGPWPRITKWVLLAATYVMNTWAFWAVGSASGVVLHSVPPLVVVLAAEAVTDLQYALSDCANHAGITPTEPRAPTPTEQATHAPVNTGERHPQGASGSGEHRGDDTRERVTHPSGEHPRGSSMRPPTPPTGSTRTATQAALGPNLGEQVAPKKPGKDPGVRARPVARRKLLADYLSEARAAWTPGVVVTPAWARQVTHCSRGLSSTLAAALNTELTAPHGTTTESEPERRAA